MRSRETALAFALALEGCCMGGATPPSAPSEPPAPLCSGPEVPPGSWAPFASALGAHVCYAEAEGLVARSWGVPIADTRAHVDAFAISAHWVRMGDWVDEHVSDGTVLTARYLDGARTLEVSLETYSRPELVAIDLDVIDDPSAPPAPPPTSAPDVPADPDCEVPREGESFEDYMHRCMSE